MKLYFFLNKLYNNKTKFIKRLYKQQQKKYNNKIKYNYIYINNNNRYFIK